MKNAAWNNGAVWQFSTMTAKNGAHFRFQGRDTGEGMWYVHVCQLRLNRWARVSYGYFPGRSLAEISKTWTDIYEDISSIESVDCLLQK